MILGSSRYILALFERFGYDLMLLVQSGDGGILVKTTK